MIDCGIIGIVGQKIATSIDFWLHAAATKRTARMSECITPKPSAARHVALGENDIIMILRASSHSHDYYLAILGRR